MAGNPPIGVLLSVEEAKLIVQLLSSLKADDLIDEERRQRALVTMGRVTVDLHRLEKDRKRSSVSNGDAVSQ